MKYDQTTLSTAVMVGAVVLYFGVVSPMMDSINRARVQLSREQSELAAAQLAITQIPDIKANLATLEKRNLENRNQLMSPLLNSYGMRAKSLLAKIAWESGLTNVEYGEGSYRALPIPKDGIPQRRTGRHSVSVKTLADYAAVASFVLRIEKELPLMTVQAITITPSKGFNFERQDVELILEWPCEGEVIQ